VPIDKVMNWVGGFTDERTTLNFIASGGTPVSGVTSGGKIIKARMEHIWVEAYVPYGNYRGTLRDQSAKTWIPMDASFKQHLLTSGIDLQQAVPFDGQGLLDQVQSTAIVDPVNSSVTRIDSNMVETTQTNYQNQLQGFITQNHPTATVGDILGLKTIQATSLPFLAGSLPYKTIVRGLSYSNTPDSLRYKLTFELITDALLGSELTYTAPLAQLAEKRMTLSYDPATSSDQAIIDSYTQQFAPSLPAYLIRLKPKLKIDGVETASGSSIGMGTDQTLQLTFTSPSVGGEIVTHTIVAGDYSAISLNTSQVTADMLQKRIDKNDFAEPVGEMLHQTLLSYWGEVDAFNHVVANESDVITLRHPSEGLAASKVTATTLFGVPNQASYKSRTLDIARDLQTAVHQTGNPKSAFSYFSQAGIYSSALEGLIFDQLFGGNPGDGISTVRILNLANSLSVPIYFIDATNVATVLPRLQVSNQVKTTIRDAINAGKVVQVPQREVTHNGWTGVGYIVQDPVSGAEAYLISGGLAGGTSDTEVSFCVPLPEVPISGVVGLIISKLASSAGLDFYKESGGGMFIAAAISTPKPSDVLVAPGPLLKALVITIIIFGMLKDIADKIKVPPRYETYRHYTTLASRDSILASGVIDSSGNPGDLKQPGIYLTKLMLEPTDDATRNLIKNALGIPFERTEAYVQIQIDLNRVQLIHSPDYPNQYLYPKIPMYRSPPEIIF
jgi:hypothetical protein